MTRKGLSRKFIVECIEHYQSLITYYTKSIKRMEKQIKTEGISENKKKGFEMLIDVCKNEIKSCQKEIMRLIK